jgi:hypothetical protein
VEIFEDATAASPDDSSFIIKESLTLEGAAWKNKALR